MDKHDTVYKLLFPTTGGCAIFCSAFCPRNGRSSPVRDGVPGVFAAAALNLGNHENHAFYPACDTQKAVLEALFHRLVPYLNGYLGCALDEAEVRYRYAAPGLQTDRKAIEGSACHYG